MKLLFFILIVMPSIGYSQFSETVNCDGFWIYSISYKSEKSKLLYSRTNKSINDLICKGFKNKQYSIIFENIKQLRGNTIKFNFKRFDSTAVIAIDEFLVKGDSSLKSKCLFLQNDLLSEGAVEFYKPRKKMTLLKFLELFKYLLKQYLR